MGATSTYAGDRTICDADSHVMELPDWLPSYADPAIRDRIRPLHLGGAGKLAANAVARAAARRGDEEAAVALEAELMTKTGWHALGAFDRSMVHTGGGGRALKHAFHDNGRPTTDLLGEGSSRPWTA